MGEETRIAKRSGGIGGGQDVNLKATSGEVLGEAEGAHHHDAADGGEGVGDEEKTDGRRSDGILRQQRVSALKVRVGSQRQPLPWGRGAEAQEPTV